MSAIAKIADDVPQTSSKHSARLQALREEATEIRNAHLAGKISAEEAAIKLEELKLRHVGFLERLIGF